MASADLWADFETLRHSVKLNTVDRLKQILQGFNEECGSNFTKSGKKQDLIDRITRELDHWKGNGITDRWTKGKAIMQQVRSTGMYTPRNAGEGFYNAASSYAASSTPAFNSRPVGNGGHLPPYDQYAPPRRPTVPPTTAMSSLPSAPLSPSSQGIKFKYSPFFRIERQVSNVVECPESTSHTDRKQQAVTFQMTGDIISKMTSQSPKYQLRLYCTSSTYYSPVPSFRSNNVIYPIEFPPTCEIRVNGTPLSANVKGMKKKPGTAPPADLGKSIRLTPGCTNRLEIIYVNTQQPIQSKKYYLVVMLVEVTSVAQLVERVRKGKYRSCEEILAKMQDAASEDDDIVASHSTMSLKCPLSYMRITTPCRSSACAHSQCFDAFSWFSVMEQTTTWLCPICEKILNTDDLIVDGYFDEMLKETSEDVEDVIVEVDGQWHTADNKYASAAWRASHPAVKDPPVSVPPTPKKRSPSPVKPVLNGDGSTDGPSSAEIVILDSDEEDEQVKRELSPSTYKSAETSVTSLGSLPPRSQTVDSDVIDLTLDSDDDEPRLTKSLPPLPKKRRSDDAASPTEQIWKKSRVDSSAPPGSGTTSSSNAASNTPSSNGYTNGSSRYSSPAARDPTRILPPPSPNRYTNYMSHPRHNYPSSHPHSAPIPPRETRPLPPHWDSNPLYLPRPNSSNSSASNSRWRG